VIASPCSARAGTVALTRAIVSALSAEDGFQLVDCGNCKISPVCGLPRTLNDATAAFLAVLDRQTLDQIVADQAAARSLLALAPISA
jgi:DNA-binding IscR family transcriptional regulator